MSTVRTPYSQGWDAGYRGLMPQNNPFLVIDGGKHAFDWMSGWYDGRDVAKSDLAEKRRESAR